MRTGAAAILAFVLIAAAAAAEPLLVMPVQAIGAPAGAAEALGFSIESAFVDSGAYDVTSPADTGLLLEAQSMYMSGMFEESRLPALGKFLPASLAALSRVEPEGKGWILQLKVVDISSGRILRSRAASISDFAASDEAVRQAVFALLGMEGAAEAKQGSFDILISSDVRDAQVFVDRRPRGQTPCAVAVSPGDHLIELRKGAYYASRSLQAQSSARLDFILGMRYGSIIVKSEPADPEITVGDVFYNKQSLIDRVPAERQLILLRKPGWFWRGEVPVFPDANTTVNVRLLPTASLSVVADDKTSSRLVGQGVDRRLMASGSFDDLLPGTYTLSFERQNRQSESMRIELASGDARNVEPILLTESKAALRQEDLRTDISRLEALQAGIGISPEFRDSPVPELGTQATGDFFLSFIPLVNTMLLSPLEGLPPAIARSVRVRRIAQFSLGSLAAASVLAVFLAPLSPYPTEIGAAALSLTALSAVADLGISIADGIRLDAWQRRESRLKEEYDKLSEELDERRGELGALRD